jgi:hypothetical protein
MFWIYYISSKYSYKKEQLAPFYLFVVFKLLWFEEHDCIRESE